MAAHDKGEIFDFDAKTKVDGVGSASDIAGDTK